MAISATRVKFLDKENKVLVKPIKDFISNEIFSDFITSFLDTDLVSGFLGQQNLLNLQSGINSLSSFLTDTAVSAFSVNTLLTGLNFSSPQLAHLATTINAIKAMDQKTVSLFLSSLVEVATDKLIDNPSLVNLYQSVTSDVKAQTLLSALDVFANKLSTGQTTLASFTSQLRQAAGEDFDLTKVNTLLAAVRSNTKTLDLRAVITGSATLASSFLEGLTALEAKVELIGNGLGGAVGADNLAVKVIGTSPAAESASTIRVVDADMQKLLIAYLSVKKAYVLAHLTSTSTLYEPITFLQYVQTPAGREYLTSKLTGDVKVAPAEQADLLIKVLCFLFEHMRANAALTPRLTAAELTTIFATTGNSITSALDFLLSNIKPLVDTSLAASPAITAAKDYINDPAYTATPDMAFAGFSKGQIAEKLIEHTNKLTSGRILTYLKTPGAKPSVEESTEVVAGIIAYTTLQVVKYFITECDAKLLSYDSLVNIIEHLCVSVFTFEADKDLADSGYKLGDPLLVETSDTDYIRMMTKLYTTIDKSKAVTASIDSVPQPDRAMYQALKRFNERVATFVGTPQANTNYESIDNLRKLYDVYNTSTSALDDEKFADKAVSIERVAFSASSDSVTII